MTNYDASYLNGLINEPDQSPMDIVKSAGSAGSQVQDDDGLITPGPAMKSWWGEPTNQGT